MNKAQDHLKETIDENESRNKELVESNKVYKRELESLETEYLKLESNKKLLNIEINNCNQEIKTLSQCYDFVKQLLTDDKQSDIDNQINSYWDEHIKN